MKYLYEASSAFIKAGLENEYSDFTKSSILMNCEKNKFLLTSNIIFPTRLSKIYEVIGVCLNVFEIKKLALRNFIGKITLKYNISPSDYWKSRNNLEKGLNGKNFGYLFVFDNPKRYILCKELD
jgi:hypothetical protein